MRYIISSAVRAAFHVAGKSVSTEALEVVDAEVQKIINRAIRNTAHFNRVRAADVVAKGIPPREGR